MLRKVFSVLLVAVMVLGMMTMPAMAYNEDQDLINRLLDSPDLKPGDLLEAGMWGLVLRRHNWDHAQLSVSSSITNPGRGSETDYVHVYAIYGDSVEFNEVSALVYEDDSVMPNVRKVFSDGELMAIYVDPTKHEMMQEVFAAWRIVCGSQKTHVLDFVLNENGDPVIGTSVEHVEPGQESANDLIPPYPVSRPSSNESILDVIELGYFENGDVSGFLSFDFSKLPPNPNNPTDVPEPTNSGFTDVATSHWAKGNIMSCVAKGLVEGMGDGTFEPESALTKAQVAQIAFNAYGDLPTTESAMFQWTETIINPGGEDKVVQRTNDVSANAWYYKAVEWLVRADLAELSLGEADALGSIMNEGDFYPSSPAPRWFIADVLYKLALRKGVTLPQTVPAVSFPDLTGEYAQYADAVYALQRAGIIAGFPDGTFGPDESLTRAQMAKMIDLFTNISGLEP